MHQASSAVFNGVRDWLRGKSGAGFVVVIGAWLCIPLSIEARTTLSEERSIGDMLQSKPSEKDDSAPKQNNLGVVPQIGYSSEQGIKAGVKLVGRNLGDTGLTIDLNTLASLTGQQSYSIGAMYAKFFEGRLIMSLDAGFSSDPSRSFYGLGNNDINSDPLSTHRMQRITSELLVAWRLFDRFAVAFSASYRNIQIGHGDASDDDDIPFTVDAFPNLTGVDGGSTIPLSLAFIYNSRLDVTRPTKGWNIIAEIEHVSRSLGSDFEFTRLSLETSYLWPLLTHRQVIAFRLGGVHMLGDGDDIPFYELTDLGGSDSLRGYFGERFLGTSRLLGTVEYRLKLLDFQFFNLWQVRIDGVGFIEAGRVFMDRGDIDKQLALDPSVSRLSDDIRYSYGGGLRIALGQAILARIDVGFSEEKTALVYLAFGHTF